MPIVNTVEDLVRLLRENEEFRAAARRELFTGQERRETDRPLVEFDGTVVAQKVLSAVIRTGESYAAAHVVDVLQGGLSSTVLELGHDRLSVFGIEREMDRDELLAIVDQLVERELAARTSRTHPALYVTPRGRAFLKDRETITLLRAAGDPPLQESEDPDTMQTFTRSCVSSGRAWPMGEGSRRTSWPPMRCSARWHRACPWITHRCPASKGWVRIG